MIDPQISAYYDKTTEASRLQQGVSQLEELRTRELIQRHLASGRKTIVDVGGAAGAYAFWLAELGHSVHLIDPMQRHVAEANERNATAPAKLESCRVGDAREIPFDDASADVVLFLGPLYHLVAAADRERAIREAARVLVPGGLLFAAGISRCASALDGLSRELLDDAVFRAIVARDLEDGQHRNPTNRVDYFTTSYFHRPEQLRAEVETDSLEVRGLYGIEGPGWLLADFADRWSDERRRETILQVARMLESMPEIIGCSAHLLVVARRKS